MMDNLMLIIVIAGERVAIRSQDVESVVEIEGLTPVPCAAAHVRGLSALRSRVLTVIDCRTALGLGETPIGAIPEAIVADCEGHPYALLVDGVEDVVEHDGEILPVRAGLSAGWGHAARGMIDVGGDALLLIDVNALIARPLADAA